MKDFPNYPRLNDRLTSFVRLPGRLTCENHVSFSFTVHIAFVSLRGPHTAEGRRGIRLGGGERADEHHDLADEATQAGQPEVGEKADGCKSGVNRHGGRKPAKPVEIAVVRAFVNDANDAGQVEALILAAGEPSVQITLKPAEA